MDGAISEAKGLRGANLRGVDLESRDLSKISLEFAVFDRKTKWPKSFQPKAASVYVLEPGAQLQNAYLFRKNLDSIDLRDSNLRRAQLDEAHLSNSDLRRADLRGAFLAAATLRGADLSGADLRGTNLFAADLREAKLTKAKLRGAIAAPETRWPRGFDPKSAGVSFS
jgi:uncharacterized protein YjbI with pentapeptide repeats